MKRLWTFRKTDNEFMNERNKFSSSPKRPSRWGLPSLLLYPGAKRLGRDVDQSLPTTAEVRNEWSCTSNPPHMPSRSGQGHLHFYIKTRAARLACSWMSTLRECCRCRCRRCLRRCLRRCRRRRRAQH